MMTLEDWMNLRALRPLQEAGYSYQAIADIAGCDWRTAKRYLESDEGVPAYGPRRSPRKLIDPFTALIDTWLRAEIKLKGTTIHERLAADPYNFPGSYQRVKQYVRSRRPQIAAELGLQEPAPMHRRFETLAGAQAQVDWGDEGTITTGTGEIRVYSFHIVLSYSRDPFCCYVTSQDLATFWDCHRRAFDHFSGVPATIVYDRTKTVVKNHVGKGVDGSVELHPEAVAFAAHYDFAIRLCHPYRPETKGKVERMVELTREKVLTGRSFNSISEMDRAWHTWLPTRRAQVHRTHGEVIALRAERDRAALRGVPPRPYVVSDRHLRWSARTRSYPSRHRCTRCRGRRSAPASGSSCGPPGTRSRSSRSEPTPPTSRPTLAPGRAAPGSWTTPTGTGCPTAPSRTKAPAAREPMSQLTSMRVRQGLERRSPGGRSPPTTRYSRDKETTIMSELVTDRIRTHAERLRLPHIAETADALIERAEKKEMGYREFLDLALEDEVGVREGRRFRNALKLSGLPHHKGLDEFEFAFQPELDARKIKDLAALAFVEHKANVCLLGPPGVGKTMLAVGLSIAACQAGYSIYFTTLDDMVRNLKEADASGRFAKKLRTYLKPAVLVLDEVGYLPLSRAEGNMVFQLVSRRYERGSIILTSNKSFSEMGQVFGDDVLATAILDRLLHHSEVISISGPSYRLKDRMTPEGGGAS